LASIPPYAGRSLVGAAVVVGASGIAAASLAVDRDRVVAIVACLVRLAAAVDIACTVDSLAVGIVAAIGPIVVVASLAVTAVEDRTGDTVVVDPRIVVVASSVDRLAVVAWEVPLLLLFLNDLTTHNG
jgi:hypothetical protein